MSAPATPTPDPRRRRAPLVRVPASFCAIGARERYHLSLALDYHDLVVDDVGRLALVHPLRGARITFWTQEHWPIPQEMPR